MKAIFCYVLMSVSSSKTLVSSLSLSLFVRSSFDCSQLSNQTFCAVTSRSKLQPGLQLQIPEHLNWFEIDRIGFWKYYFRVSEKSNIAIDRITFRDVVFNLQFTFVFKSKHILISMKKYAFKIWLSVHERKWASESKLVK